MHCSEKIMNKCRKLIIFYLSIVFFLSMTSSVKAIQTLTGYKDLKPIHVKISEFPIKSTSEIIEIDIKIPRIEGIKDKNLENKINKNFENRALAFKEDVEDLSKKYENKTNQLENMRKFVCKSNFEVSYNNNNILSVPVIYYQYTGGAHGVYSKKTYNVNLKTGEELFLKDLFKDNFDYKKLIDEGIRNNINEEPKNYFQDSFKGISDNQDFYITNDSIVVYFQLYEIAPYSAGIPEFKIPFSCIKKVLKVEL